MVVLTRADLSRLCRKAVANMGDHPNMNSEGIPRRIDTFVGLIDSDPDLISQAFGANFSDYVQGKFYSRTWEAAGADPSNMRGAYPLIMFEQKLIDWNISNGTESDEIIVLSLDKNGCDGCPAEVLSPHSAYDTAKYWLKGFIDNLISNEIIQILPSEEKVWLTLQEAQAMKDRGEIVDFKRIGGQLGSYIQGNKLQMKPFSDGAINGVRGYVTTLNVRLCEVFEGANIYDPVQTNRVAVQNCESCP